MKSILKFLFFVFASLFFTNGINTSAQTVDQECRISDIKFSYTGTLSETTPVKLTITPDPETPACQQYGNPFSIRIIESTRVDDTIYEKGSSVFKTDGSPFVLDFLPGNEFCYSDDACNLYVTASIENISSNGRGGANVSRNTIHSSDPEEPTGIFTNQQIAQQAQLSFTPQNTPKKFQLNNIQLSDEEESSCRIGNIEWDLSEITNKDQLIDSGKPVNLHIDTRECIGKNIEIRIIEVDELFGSRFWESEAEVAENIIIKNDRITSTYIPGETNCDIDTDEDDCKIAAAVTVTLKNTCARNENNCELKKYTEADEYLTYNLSLIHI